MAQSFGDMLLRKQQGLPCPVCYLSVCASVAKESDECSVVMSALAIKLTQCYNMVTFFPPRPPLSWICPVRPLVSFIFLQNVCIFIFSMYFLWFLAGLCTSLIVRSFVGNSVRFIHRIRKNFMQFNNNSELWCKLTYTTNYV